MSTKALVAGVLLAAAVTAQAVPATINSLSRDVGVDNVIVDSLNNRQWLGWDATRSYTLAERDMD